MGVLQRTLSDVSASQTMGGDCPSATPDAPGPRNDGQFSGDSHLQLAFARETGKRSLGGLLGIAAQQLARSFQLRGQLFEHLLLDSRVAMLEAVELTRQSTVNLHYVALLGRAHESLTRGESLSSAISAGGLIDPAVCQAVKNGERTGQIGPVLSSMAERIVVGHLRWGNGRH